MVGEVSGGREERGVEKDESIYQQNDHGRKNAQPSIYSQEAVCVSPTSGHMYTTTVELINTEIFQDEDGTSECNPGLRAESRKIFEEYKPRVEHQEGIKFKKRSRSRSRARYRTQSRDGENVTKYRNQRRDHEDTNTRYRSKSRD